MGATSTNLPNGIRSCTGKRVLLLKSRLLIYLEPGVYNCTT